MAGNATEQELILLARLRADEMVESLSRLDEHGWVLARAVLHELALRRMYSMDPRRAGPSVLEKQFRKKEKTP
jgi:hypothetical protein